MSIDYNKVIEEIEIIQASVTSDRWIIALCIAIEALKKMQKIKDKSKESES